MGCAHTMLLCLANTGLQGQNQEGLETLQAEQINPEANFNRKDLSVNLIFYLFKIILGQRSSFIRLSKTWRFIRDFFVKIMSNIEFVPEKKIYH